MIHTVVQIARGAAEKILEVYSRGDVGVETKSDDSPVTLADLASEQFIVSRLKEEFDYPILSEETPVDYEKRKDWQKYWCVDPLDGTKNFIAGDGEFTVNIALIEGDEPVAGVVYLPVSGEAYFAEKGKGAFRIVGGDEERIENKRTDEELVCAVSKFHDSPATEEFCQKHNIVKRQKYGSSLKLCKLAEGKIDVYPRLAPTKEWDTAAAHCIVNEAGGKVLDVETKEPLKYNKPEILNNFFVASRNDLSFLD
jgi:3'(2'), 5'-bisphosphate nucleotidase